MTIVDFLGILTHGGVIWETNLLKSVVYGRGFVPLPNFSKEGN